MIFHETHLPGVFIIDLERFEDERGFFACSWRASEFEQRGLNHTPKQRNVAFNAQRGTLRGMHFQNQPHEEAKLVQCTRGAVYDVAIDLRPDSPTLHQWVAVELTAENQRMLYIPEGFAHGYQTLTDEATLHYQVSEYYHPESAGGVRWDDPVFGIQWPLPVAVIAERDASYPSVNREDR
jgi:dTDP-4-dehydrorhamnose 3,5-epimerase